MKKCITNEKELAQILIYEEEDIVALKESSVGKKLEETRKKLLKFLKQVYKNGNLEEMIGVEKQLLNNDLFRYNNSQAMESSLKTAINEIKNIQKLLTIVDNKTEYQAINEGYALPKNRHNGLPLDEARQAFKSHFARLVNMDKSRLDDVEKQIINTRKLIINEAQRLYIARQANSLGIALKNSQKLKR